MSMEQVEEGRRWIEATLVELATGSAVKIDRVEWHRSADDVRAGTESLALEAQGQRLVERFRLADLEDIPGDSGVRNGVEGYLVTLVVRIAAAPSQQA